MGPVQFERITYPLEVADQTFKICAVSIGNPHCVLLCDTINAALAQQYGALIEQHPLFPERTNVQFMRVQNRHAIQIKIWERGAGYTLASGSSACAAAAVAHQLGLVHMPGGALTIELSQQGVILTGAVVKVAEGLLSAESLPHT